MSNLDIMKAWVGHHYSADVKDIDLILRTGRCGGLLTLSHPSGIVYLNEDYLHSDFTHGLKKVGHGTRMYRAFEAGFKNQGKLPGWRHPILRHYYKVGLAAKVKKATAA